MAMDNQQEYSNCAVQIGDQILNVDGMPAAHASIDQLNGLFNGLLHSPVHLALASFETGELYTVCVLRHNQTSQSPTQAANQFATEPMEGAVVNLNRIANPRTARSAPQARGVPPLEPVLGNVMGHTTSLPKRETFGVYLDTPKFGRVLKKSGVLWRKNVTACSVRGARGDGWDVEPEKCECRLAGGVLKVRSCDNPNVFDESFDLDLSQWTLDTQINSTVGGRVTLVQMGSGRLVELFADSDQAGDDWRRALVQSMPNSTSDSKNLRDLRSDPPQLLVPSTIIKQIPRSTKAASPLQNLPRSSHLQQLKSVQTTDRESGLQVLVYGRNYGTLRCCYSHWKVFGLKGVVGVVEKDYEPVEEAQKREALGVDDVVAVIRSNGHGWSKGWHLPDNRWTALTVYPREFWFPSQCVSVEGNSSGYFGRIWPLTINVVGARNLPCAESKKKPDPYVTVQVSNERKETARRKKTSSPLWVQQVEFEVEEDEMVSFVVWDWNDVKRDTAIGYLEISAGRLVEDCEAAWNDATNQSRLEKDLQILSSFPGTKGYKLFSEDGLEILGGADQEEALILLQAVPKVLLRSSALSTMPQQAINGQEQASSASDMIKKELISPPIKPHSSPQAQPNGPDSSSCAHASVPSNALHGQDGGLRVTEFKKGANSVNAGSKRSHLIINVDGTDIQHMPAGQAAGSLTGPVGSSTRSAGSVVTATASRVTSGVTSMHTVELICDVFPIEYTHDLEEETAKHEKKSSTAIQRSSPLPTFLDEQPEAGSKSNKPSLIPLTIQKEIPISSHQDTAFKPSPSSEQLSAQPCEKAEHIGAEKIQEKIQEKENERGNTGASVSCRSPEKKKFTFKVWVISGQHQPTKFIVQNFKHVNILTRHVDGETRSSYTTSNRNNKEHPIWEESFDLELDGKLSAVKFVIDEVGENSLSLEQLKDLSTRSLPRSADRDSAIQAHNMKPSMSFKSLTKSLSFKSKKSQSELIKHKEILKSYPGAFALPLMQANGEPLKNKKGESPVIYLHVLLTSETPDPEPEMDVIQNVPQAPPPRRDSECSLLPFTNLADEQQHMQEQMRMLEALQELEKPEHLDDQEYADDQVEQLTDLENDIDSRIMGVSSPVVAYVLESVQEGRTQTPTSAPDSKTIQEQTVSENLFPIVTTPPKPVESPRAESPSVDRSTTHRPPPLRKTSSGVEDMKRIFGEKSPSKGSDVSNEPFFLRSPAVVSETWMNVGDGPDASRQRDPRGVYPVAFELVEGKNWPHPEVLSSSFMCLVQVGDHNFQTSENSSSVFAEGSAVFKFLLQHDDEILVTVIDVNGPIMDNVVGTVKIPAERLVTSHVHGGLFSKCKTMSDPHSLINDVYEFPLVTLDGFPIVEPVKFRASTLMVRCKPCSGADMNEAVKVGVLGDTGFKAPTHPQQIISNKISVFDGSEDLCGQRLYLKIVSARHLTYRSSNSKFCNPYCKGRLGEQRFQTTKCMATTDPDWSGDTFELEVSSRKDHLHLQVLDWDMLQMDRIVGHVKVAIHQVLRDTVEINKKSGFHSKTTSSSSALAGKNTSSSSVKISNGSFANNKNTSSSSLGMSEASEDAPNKASYKIFTSEG